MNAARVLVAACLAFAAAAAHAHVFLERAEPRVGAKLQAAPAEVKLWFSEPLDPAASGASITDAKGIEIDQPTAAKVDADNRMLLRVALPPLAPGAYTVHWRAASPDGHAVKGKFVFRIAP